MRGDYRQIRRHIARVVPGCESYEVNVARPGGFVMPHPPRDSRTFTTKSGRAEFTVSTIEALQVPPDHLILQTLRSHDQFNTTIYGFSDRYRGIERGRHVVFVNPQDIEELGFRDGDLVDLVTHWEGDDHVRRAHAFRIVAYQTPRGSAAAYYPETILAGSARLDGTGQQYPDLEVGDHPVGAARNRPLDPGWGSAGSRC